MDQANKTVVSMEICPNVVIIAGIIGIVVLEGLAIWTRQDGKYFELAVGLIFSMATGAPHLPALWTPKLPAPVITPPQPPAQ